jgi:hypothetical protein
MTRPRVGLDAPWLARGGYKYRREVMRRGNEMVSLLETAGRGIWAAHDGRYISDVLAGWAKAIEEDFTRQREKLVVGDGIPGSGIPKQMVKSRLERWDQTLGKERVSWTVCARKLSDLGDGVTPEGISPTDDDAIIREACRLWTRAISRHEARPKILEV